MTRVGGVGDRAGGCRLFSTRVDAGGAGGGYGKLMIRQCSDNLRDQNSLVFLSSFFLSVAVQDQYSKAL